MKKPSITLAVVLLGLLLPAYASATTFEVDTLDDVTSFEGCVNVSTECSLRDAILRANEGAQADEIEFGEIFAGTIELTEPLPAITQPVDIDATTAADYSDAGHPVIVLDGSLIEVPESRGLEIQENAGGSRIEGLSIGGFRIGIFAYSEATSHICGNYVGVLPDGKTALPNTYAGISTGQPAEEIRIGFECSGNLISGNSEFGILEVGHFTKIARNRIGVDVDGNPLPNGDLLKVSAGIQVHEAAEGTMIGGTEPGEGNVIADNEGAGVRVRKAGSEVGIRANSIHDNALAGIEVVEGAKTAVPVLEFVKGSVTESEVLGTLNGLPDETYELDFFINKSCAGNGTPGQGELLLGEGTVETDSSGFGIISVPGLDGLPVGSEYFTATATPLTKGLTSTFSGCWDQPPDTQLTSQPENPTSSPEATFAFTGSDFNGSVASFLCRLDGEGLGTCTTPKSYAELDDGSHSFEVMAVDQAGSVDVTPLVYTWTVGDEPDPPGPPAPPGLPIVSAAPVNGESVAVAPESGTVKVKRPGESKATILKEGQTIPVGSLVDATNGKVTLTSVNAAGEAQTAVFYGGKFVVAQHEGSGLVILKLRGGNFASCKGGARKSDAQASGRSGRRLWGSGKGKFRTEGNYGSATVRGTVWLTEDRCGGTFFKVKRGVVSVRDFVVSKTLSLGPGKSYFAKKEG